MATPARKILKYGGYALFTLSATLLFIYLGFPLQSLHARLQREVLNPQGIELTFAQGSLYRLSGVHLEGVTIKMISPISGELVSLNLDSVKARLQLLPLLRGHQRIAFEIEAGEGTIEGESEVTAERFDLILNIDHFNLRSPPLLSKLALADIAGELETHIDLSLTKEPQLSRGGGTVTLKKIQIGNGLKLNIPISGFPVSVTLPATALGNVTALFEIQSGKILMKTFEQKGADLQTQLKGEMTLRMPLSLSPLNLELQYKFTPDFVQKNPVLQILSNSCPTKSADGTCTRKIGGTWATPQ